MTTAQPQAGREDCGQPAALTGMLLARTRARVTPPMVTVETIQVQVHWQVRSQISSELELDIRDSESGTLRYTVTVTETA